MKNQHEIREVIEQVLQLDSFTSWNQKRFIEEFNNLDRASDHEVGKLAIINQWLIEFYKLNVRAAHYFDDEWSWIIEDLTYRDRYFKGSVERSVESFGDNITAMAEGIKAALKIIGE